MADDLATLQARRDALQRAIYSGAKSVRQGDTSTEFRTMDELLAALALIDQQIAALTPAKRYRQVKVRHRSDWE